MSFPLDAWFRRRRRAGQAGWLALYSATPQRMVAAWSAPGTAPRPRVISAPVFDADDPAAALLRWQRAERRQAATSVVLNSVDYRIVAQEMPAVPPAERREALRWQLKDLIDFPAEGACIDCIEVPGPMPGQPPRQVFTIATPPELVRGWAARYREQRLHLGAIDIPEMAMRNLSVLAAGDAAHAFVHLGLKSTRLVLVWQRELCAFRQFDVSAFKLDAADEDTRALLIERMALEIQRSTDSFARQFHGADLKTVWVSAVRDADEVSRQLAQLLPQELRSFRVEDHVELVGDLPVVDPGCGLDFTFAIGGALRPPLH